MKALPTEINIYRNYREMSGPGSAVGVATPYGLEGPGFEPGESEIFLTRPSRPQRQSSLLFDKDRCSMLWGKAAGAWR